MGKSFNYEIRPSTTDCPTDAELEQLLERIYIDGGFADADALLTRFSAKAVRERGDLLVAIHRETQKPVGMVIVVPPNSPAHVFADASEAEMHLLGVLPEHRGAGLGHALVESAMRHAQLAGYARMLLWTQPAMKQAHSLYNKVGFVHDHERDFVRNGKEFFFMIAEL